MTRRVILRSPLDPVAAARALKAAVEAAPTADQTSKVDGHGSDQELTLRNRRKRQGDAIAPALTGTIEPDGTGSRIEARFALPRAQRVFVTLWFGFLSLFMAMGLGFALLLPGEAALPVGGMFMGVPLFMMGVMLLILASGRRTAREDRTAILAFLRDTIAAEVIAGTDTAGAAAQKRPGGGSAGATAR